MATSIMIVDDHRLFREGLKNLLLDHPEFLVAGEASDGSMVIKMVKELKPQIILMDISMPNLNGVEASRQILAENPGIQIIVLSMHANSKFVHEALKTGVKGYVLKDSAFEELILALQTVCQKKIFLSATINDMVIRSYIDQKTAETAPSVFSRLTPREREICQLIAEGRNTKEIANLLTISAKTVETHRKQIMDKLEIKTVAEITRFAIREGLTTL